MNINNVLSGQLPNIITQPSENSSTPNLSTKQTQAGNILSNSHVELAVDKVIQTMLRELCNMIEVRTNLIDLLPDNIKEQAQELLKQNMITPEKLKEGLAPVIKSQKDTILKLINLTESLKEDMFQVEQQDHDVLPAKDSVLKPANLITKNDSSLKYSTVTKEQSLPQEVLITQELFLPEDQSSSQSTMGKETSGSKDLQGSSLLQKAASLKLQEPILTDIYNKLTKAANDNEGIADLIMQLKNDVLPKKVEKETVQSLVNILKGYDKSEGAEQGKSVLAKAVQHLLKQAPEAISKNVDIPDMPKLWATIKLLDSKEVLTNSLDLKNSTLTKADASVHKAIEHLLMNINETLAKALCEDTDLNNLVQNLKYNRLPEKLDSETLEKLSNILKSYDTLKDAEQGEKALTKAVQHLLKQAPETIVKHSETPEIPKAWAMVKLVEHQEVLTTLRQLKVSVQEGMTTNTTNNPENKSLSLSMPLYLGDGMTPYPAHIHIYHEKDESQTNSQGRQIYETWLRISVETENLGVVHIIFRLYKGNQLDVRLSFNNLDGKLFPEVISDIRDQISDGKLNVNDITIT